MLINLKNLNDVFIKSNLPYVIGNSISCDQLLQLGLQSQSTNKSPIDNEEFIQGVVDSDDSNKIKLLTYFSNLCTSNEKLNKFFWTEENMVAILGNHRNKYVEMHVKELSLILLKELNKEIDYYFNMSPLLSAFASNPIIHRACVADIISASNTFSNISVESRIAVGVKAIKAKYIDYSYFGQEFPTLNELDFDKPNQSFFNLIVDLLSDNLNCKKDEMVDRVFFYIPNLVGLSCFDPSKFYLSQDKDYEDYSDSKFKGALKFIDWVLEVTSNIERLEGISKIDFQRGVICSILLFCVIEDNYGKEEYLLTLIKEKQTNWVIQASVYFYYFRKKYKKLLDLDDSISRSKKTFEISNEYIKSEIGKLNSQEIVRPETSGEYIGYLLCEYVPVRNEELDIAKRKLSIDRLGKQHIELEIGKKNIDLIRHFQISPKQIGGRLSVIRRKDDMTSEDPNFLDKNFEQIYNRFNGVSSGIVVLFRGIISIVIILLIIILMIVFKIS